MLDSDVAEPSAAEYVHFSRHMTEHRSVFAHISAPTYGECRQGWDQTKGLDRDASLVTFRFGTARRVLAVGMLPKTKKKCTRAARVDPVRLQGTVADALKLSQRHSTKDRRTWSSMVALDTNKASLCEHLHIHKHTLMSKCEIEYEQAPARMYTCTHMQMHAWTYAVTHACSHMQLCADACT